MSELAPALARWAALLEPLSRGLRPTIAAQAQRLALVIGPLCSQQAADDGEPDGFDGLSLRGSYDRLSSSEWLLADVLPDEFLRRAAMREHLFLKLARRDLQPALTCAVLLDAGPDQLGAPRIAQLAALVVLTRRAAEAGAELRWGTLQDLDTSLFGPIDASTVAAFLNARATRDPDAGDVEAWRWCFAKEPLPSELWLVGGDALASVTHDLVAHRLHLAEPAMPGPRTVVATVTREGRQATVELTRAPIGTEAQVLVSPFAPTSHRDRSERGQPHLTVPAGAPMWFSPSGRRLFVRDLAHPRPGTAGEPPIRWVARKVLSEGDTNRSADHFIEVPVTAMGHRLIAIGWSHKSMVAARLDGAYVEVSTNPERGFIRRVRPEPRDLEILRRPHPIVPLFRRGQVFAFGLPELLFQVGAERDADARDSIVIEDLRDVRFATDTATWLQYSKTIQRFMAHHFTGTHWSTKYVGAVEEPSNRRSALLGPPERGDMVGYHDASGFLLLPRGLRSDPLRFAIDDDTPLGLVMTTTLPSVGVLALDAQRRVLRLVEVFGQATALPTDGSRILQVAVSPNEPTVAWLSANGELVCWDVVRHEERLRAAVSIVDGDGS